MAKSAATVPLLKEVLVYKRYPHAPGVASCYTAARIVSGLIGRPTTSSTASLKLTERHRVPRMLQIVTRVEHLARQMQQILKKCALSARTIWLMHLPPLYRAPTCFTPPVWRSCGNLEWSKCAPCAASRFRPEPNKNARRLPGVTW